MSDLRRELKQICEDENRLKDRITAINVALAEVRQKKQGIIERQELQNLKPRISDHALIRYCERSLGFSFDEIRDGLLSKKVKDIIEFGASSVKVEHGKFLIADKCMTTFIANKG